jgi:hypothetical protein
MSDLLFFSTTRELPLLRGEYNNPSSNYSRGAELVYEPTGSNFVSYYRYIFVFALILSWGITRVFVDITLPAGFVFSEARAELISRY